jgi:hypothetical protein
MDWVAPAGGGVRGTSGGAEQALLDIRLSLYRRHGVGSVLEVGRDWLARRGICSCNGGAWRWHALECRGCGRGERGG